MKRFDLEDKIAGVLVIIGALFRFYNYNNWSLSNDELSAITRLNYSSFSEMIEQGVRLTDMHPVGVQSFLWVWTHLFGVSETVLRLPFILLGILSIPLLYVTGKNFFGKFPALMATTVFVALEFPILYAQLARPYSPGLFFSLLVLYSWSTMMWKSQAWSWRTALWFVVGGVGTMYSHYFSFLFTAIVGLAGLFLIQKENRLKYLLCGFLMFLFYIPNINVFLYQFSIGGLGGSEGWLGPPEKDAIWKYVLYCFNESVFLLLTLFGLIVVMFFVLRVKFKWKVQHSMALLFFILPALIAYFYSVYKNPVFQYSILLFSFPCLLLLLFSWFESQVINVKNYTFLMLALLITSFSTIFAQQFYHKQNFAPFKLVVEKMATYHSMYGSKKTLATVNVIHPNYIHYYSNRYPSSPVFEQYLCNRAAHFVALKHMVDTSTAQTFIHGWSNNYHAPEVEMIIAEKFPYLVHYDPFFNAGVMVYSKDSTLTPAIAPGTLLVVTNNFEIPSWPNDDKFRTDSISIEGNWSLRMNPDQEYSSSYKSSAANLGFEKGSVYQMSCKYFSDTTLTDVVFVVSIERKGESLLWRGVHLSDFPVENETWTSFYVGYKLVEDILPDDEVIFYFYNASKQKFFIDDFVFRVLDK
ncbi:MAG: glycosyltransferase family 39 protein [Bacteroidia bacterium]